MTYLDNLVEHSEDSKPEFLKYSNSGKQFLTPAVGQDSSYSWSVAAERDSYMDACFIVRDCHRSADLDFHVYSGASDEDLRMMEEKIDVLVQGLLDFKESWKRGLEVRKANGEIAARHKENNKEVESVE